MRLFPRWADILDLEADIAGMDLPIGGEPEVYREAVASIAGAPENRGALVTTHKMDVFRHASELFEELDANATLCREISCISKRAGKLVGHAKDPITAGRSLEEMLEGDHWSAGGEALCLGAGGAGTAITVHLLRSDPVPESITIVDISEQRLEELRRVHEELGAGTTDLRYICSAEPAANDALLQSLPPRSLVVNATGMGKDRTGSPLTDAAEFPPEAIVWELNYRGALDFLRQARLQPAEKGLVVHDGWRYFLHGWTEVIAEVFHLGLSAELFEELAAAAEPFKP